MSGTVGSLALAGVVGAAVLAGAGLSFEAFESDAFCTSCHVLDGVTQEWRESPHRANVSGVAAGCADCHVDPGLYGSVRAKVRSLHAELWPWLRGIDTPEELDARREVLAETVWAHMRATDSASCRSCHQMGEASLALQTTRARTEHRDAAGNGETCIDCHDDGIAHAPIERENPEDEDEDEEWEEDDFTL